MSRTVLVCFFLLTDLLPLSAQDSLIAIDYYFQQLLNYHPSARNAALAPAMADAALLQARGAFDPKAFADWSQKAFDNKDYFSVGEAGLKAKTPLGLELKASYTTARGVFLNPADNLPEVGQAVLGVKAPLLRGLFFDANRAGMRQARIGQEAANAEREFLLNDLLAEGVKYYMDWSTAYAQLQVIEEGVQIAQVRLDNIRESFIEGDLPAVDTLETYLQLLDRRQERQRLRQEYLMFRQLLTDFWWPNGESYTFSPRAVPVLPDGAYILPQPWQSIDQPDPNHPELLLTRFKMDQLEVDYRLASENLKPRLDVSYFLLGEGFNLVPGEVDDSGIAQLMGDNYKWDLSFSFPLFLRKERGKREQVRLKQIMTENQFSQKQLQINNKVLAARRELEQLQGQLDRAQEMVDGYAALLAAERIKFELGESSVFLMNSRESKLIDARLKLVKIQGEYAKAQYKLNWAAGILADSLLQ